MEFADHRLYQPGDDIRHLDRHVYDRLKQHVVRQYSLYQPLPVTVLIDASASMGFGEPAKLPRAAQLAGILAYVGLTGNDRVQVGAYAADKIDWFPRFQGAQRATALFAWLETVTAAGNSSMGIMARESMAQLVSRGLLIVISDMMSDGVETALGMWGRARQEVVGIHLLAPDEIDPELLGAGAATLVDSESGYDTVVTLDSEDCADYRKALASWRMELDALFAAHQARLLFTRSDDELEKSVVVEWRARQLIF